MTRAELIDQLAAKMPHLPIHVIEEAVKEVFEQMAAALEKGQRIEIRRFGSFSSRQRAPRMARNPKTGDSMMTKGKRVTHFKPGKELRERVNEVIRAQQRS